MTKSHHKIQTALYYSTMGSLRFSMSKVFIDYIFSIAELPSPTDSTDMDTNINTTFPLVNLPGGELIEDEGDQGVLTSPNLVHRMNPAPGMQSLTARMQQRDTLSLRHGTSNRATDMDSVFRTLII